MDSNSGCQFPIGLGHCWRCDVLVHHLFKNSRLEQIPYFAPLLQNAVPPSLSVVSTIAEGRGEAEEARASVARIGNRLPPRPHGKTCECRYNKK